MGKRPASVGCELDDHGRRAAGDLFTDLDLLDLDAVHAVRRPHGERDALADRDFDLGGLEDKSFGDDLDDARFLGLGRGAAERA